MGNTTTVDRLIFTILFSVIVHLVVVLGISFDVTSPPTNTPLQSLDITLVKQQTETKPDKAKYLAQVTNEGGGVTDEKSPEPSPPSPAPVTQQTPKASILPKQNIPSTQPKTVQSKKPVSTEIKAATVEAKAEPKPATTKPSPVQPKKAAKKLTQDKPAEHKVIKKDQQGETAQPKQKPQTKPTPSARELMLSARNEIQALEKSLDATTRALSEEPKKRRISAATREYAAAAYMKGWELKVERIGNMNYPEEAKRMNINGSLMLSVDINPDGSVPANGITVSRSSGYEVLDKAAIKIVRLGAPYAAIPEDVLKGNDMLTIIRTWKFETNRGLSAR